MQGSYSKITFLEDIFNQSVHIGLCNNQLEFSKNIIGKNEKYFSVYKAKGRTPSVSSLAYIAMRLEKLETNYSGYKIKKSIREIREQVILQLQKRILENEQN